MTKFRGYVREASLSPDGTKVVFFANFNAPAKLFIMNADGTDMREVPLPSSLGFF